MAQRLGPGPVLCRRAPRTSMPLATPSPHVIPARMSGPLPPPTHTPQHLSAPPRHAHGVRTCVRATAAPLMRPPCLPHLVAPARTAHPDVSTFDHTPHEFNRVNYTTLNVWYANGPLAQVRGCLLAHGPGGGVLDIAAVARGRSRRCMRGQGKQESQGRTEEAPRGCSVRSLAHPRTLAWLGGTRAHAVSLPTGSEDTSTPRRPRLIRPVRAPDEPRP